MFECPECKGEGILRDYVEYMLVNEYGCYRCGGRGKITLGNIISYWFWTNVPVEFVEWYADTFIYNKRKE